MRAPSPVSTALVVTVVPWTIRSRRGQELGPARAPGAPRARRRPVSSPSDGSLGVLGDLCAQQRAVGRVERHEVGERPADVDSDRGSARSAAGRQLETQFTIHRMPDRQPALPARQVRTAARADRRDDPRVDPRRLARCRRPAAERAGDGGDVRRAAGRPCGRRCGRCAPTSLLTSARGRSGGYRVAELSAADARRLVARGDLALAGDEDAQPTAQLFEVRVDLELQRRRDRRAAPRTTAISSALREA